MKHEAFDHPKLDRAAADLGIPIAYFRGVMVTLWHAAKVHHPAGDIGRESNADIAWRAGYPGDGEEFVTVLIRHQLLDEMPPEQGRLYIHNWHLHCEDFVKQRLRARKMNFANGAPPFQTEKKKKAEKPSEDQTGEDENREEQKTSENAREEQPPTENGRKPLARNAGNRKPEFSPQTPEGACGGGTALGNGYHPPPDWAAYRNALFDYYGRDALNREWDTFHDNLVKYEAEGLLPPVEGWREMCRDVCDEVRADYGEMPKTVKPLLDCLATEVARQRE